MQHIVERHKSLWKQKEFRTSTILGLIFFVCSIVVNGLANVFIVSRHVSNHVSDLILDNTPALDVELIVVEGAVVLFFSVIVLLILRPSRIPFVVKSIALFILIRALFMSLTHIAPFPDHILFEDNIALFRAMGVTGYGDFFFSGHTGMPFLLSLIFSYDKRLRNIFLAVSLLFGTSVLLGHLHYSIDVFAAFFITYGIFHMARYLFPKDYTLLRSGK